MGRQFFRGVDNGPFLRVVAHRSLPYAASFFSGKPQQRKYLSLLVRIRVPDNVIAQQPVCMRLTLSRCGFFRC